MIRIFAKTLCIAACLASFSTGAAVTPHLGPVINPNTCSPAVICQAVKNGWLSDETAYQIKVPMSSLWAPISYGTAKATVHSQFPKVMVYNFTNNANIDATVTAMDDVYLARLSRQYYIETNGAITPLMTIAAKRLSAANLLRFKSTMGQAATDAAVNASASAAVKSAYFSGTAKAVVRRSEAMYLSMGITSVAASPNLDMTLYEIFLDYFTAGETSAAAALAMTAQYSSAYLAASFTVGYEIGTVIYWIDDQIDPDINVWIGDELGALVTDVVNFVTNPANYPAYDDGTFGTFDGETYKWDDVEP
jgi:hypothetical protein